MLVQVGRRGEPVRRVVLEPAVHLVGEQAAPGVPRDLDQRAEQLAVGQRARGVVREVDDDESRRRPEEPLEGVEVERPAARLVEREQVHLRA